MLPAGFVTLASFHVGELRDEDRFFDGARAMLAPTAPCLRVVARAAAHVARRPVLHRSNLSSRVWPMPATMEPVKAIAATQMIRFVGK